MSHTVVHLVRHGEVFNPDKVLYGRLPGFVLSDRGHQMAQRVGEYFGTGHDIARIVASPMERAQQTATPLAQRLGLTIETDGRLIEAANYFEGAKITSSDGGLRDPKSWPHLLNPLRPSWGEPYNLIAQRMLSALAAARDAAPGHESVLVSHQLPIWTTRLAASKQRLWHDPRKRQCSLASVTSFHYTGTELSLITYDEPAADLVVGSSASVGA